MILTHVALTRSGFPVNPYKKQQQNPQNPLKNQTQKTHKIQPHILLSLSSHHFISLTAWSL